MNDNKQSNTEKSSGGFREKFTDKEKQIAIVGVSGVFPQSEDINEFWVNIASGRDLVTNIPEERKEILSAEKNIGKRFFGGFYKDIDKFDSEFFGISPREAEGMDPQQRIALQVTWKCIEDAGYRVSDLSKMIPGVFFGISNIDYNEIFFKSGVKTIAHSSTGLAHSMVANRISYLFNFHGPSMSVDTACSSSLIAIYYAMEAIRNGLCDIAIAGGVNALLSSFPFLSFTSAGMLSPEGKCKTLDKNANGYVRGEGAGAIVMKPLEKAIEDNDHIYAVIKGAYINHGGKARTLTSPNVFAQSSLLFETYLRSGVSPDTVSYIELHGTGTPLGDPIEVNALCRAFGRLRKHFAVSNPEKPYCGIGSVKTNIGHLESAASIAGIVKVLLAMKYGKIPPNINYTELNPNIHLKDSPFYIVDRLLPWERLKDREGKSIPRRAGVSSFGFGGANAHIILEEYVPTDREEFFDEDEQVIFILSAKNKEGLDSYIREWLDFLGRYTSQEGIGIEQSHNFLRELAYTLQIGREPFEERFSVVVRSVDELGDVLRAYVDKAEDENKMSVYGSAGGIVNFRSTEVDLESSEDISSLIINKNYTKLSRLWANGTDIDWSLLYSPDRPKPNRLPLPTYPFKKRRFWINYDIEKSFFEPDSQIITRSNKNEGKVLQIHYKPFWKEIDIPVKADDDSIQRDQSTLVFYSDGFERLADELVKVHKDGKVLCIPVSLLRNEDEINPLMEEYMSAIRCGMIKHLKAYFLGDAASCSIVTCKGSMDNCGSKLLFDMYGLVKHLDRIKAQCGLELTVIANGAASVLSREIGEPLNASLYGFTLTLSREFPKWKVQYIDADINWEGYDGRLAGILSGSSLGDGGALPLAFAVLRKGKWYTRSLVPLAFQTTEHCAFRFGGVYIIFGGKGTVGLTVARELVLKYKARIALVGRSELSGIQKDIVRDLQALGGELAYFHGDITNEPDLNRIIQQVEEKWSAINGVFHSAMVMASGLIGKMDKDLVKKVTAPKIDGSIALYNVFKDKALDFLVFFSSIQSYLGNIGQGAYAAGSSFQDAFAVYANSRCSYPVKVINWGYWSADILPERERDERAAKELGFKSSGELMVHLKNTGFGLISAKEGIETLEMALNSDIVQLTAMKAEHGVSGQMGVDYEYEAAVIPGYEFSHGSYDGIDINVREESLPHFMNGQRKLEDFIKNSLLYFFQSKGMLLRANDRLTFVDATMSPSRERLLSQVAAIMQDGGFLRQEGDAFVATEKVEDSSSSGWKNILELKEEILKEYESLSAHVNLAWTTLSNIVGIIKGESIPTDIIFHGGSMALVEGIYDHNPLSEYMNKVAAACLVKLVKKFAKENDKIRILELGAGTGGATGSILYAIKESCSTVEYYYTDISKAFLNTGESKFGKDYPFVRYSLLDIEKDPQAQGYQMGYFDIVVGANVLHATRNIIRTLGNVKGLLKKGGIVLLNETTSKTNFTTVTFGLLDGWWLFEDEHLRIPGSPLLTPEMWENAFESCGFYGTTAIGTHPGFEEMLQHVIYAVSDGIVFREVQKEKIQSAGAAPERAYGAYTIRKTQKTGGSSASPAVHIDKVQEVEDILTDIVAEVLRVKTEDIDKTQAFLEYGLDSLLLVEFTEKISECLNVNIGATVLFNYPSIAELASYIISNFDIKLEMTADDSIESVFEMVKSGRISVNEAMKRLEFLYD